MKSFRWDVYNPVLTTVIRPPRRLCSNSTEDLFPRYLNQVKSGGDIQSSYFVLFLGVISEAPQQHAAAAAREKNLNMPLFFFASVCTHACCTLGAQGKYLQMTGDQHMVCCHGESTVNFPLLDLSLLTVTCLLSKM